MTNQKYPPKEKLKKKSEIDLLFANGKWNSCGNLRIISIDLEKKPQENFEISNQKVGVSVSKKYFKHAVDRNYFKRILRETYRLNQHLLREHLEQPYNFMFFYQTKERLSFDEINTKTIQLFEKFVAQQAQKKANEAKITDSNSTELS